MQGAPFGRYRLVELLGRGGMGEVWRAYDTAANNRTVAIKLLPPHLAQDDMFVQRFRREADAAARLNNPHIIPIHNYGEIDGRLYVDMRLIEGRDLQEVLATGPLDPGRGVRIIEQVAKALHAAHNVGLVHRDVKPSNILLDDDDFAYLIDFGIARAADDTRLTGTGNMIGTFHYMAPERLVDRPDEDARADIYALACVMYECLTGQPPFAGASVGSLVAAHLNSPPPQPSASRPNVPPQIDRVIATGMAKDPAQRYATTIELANAAHDAVTVPINQPARRAAPTTPGPRAAMIIGPDGAVSPQAVTGLRSSSALPAQATDVPSAVAQQVPRPWWRRASVVIPAAVVAVVVAAGLIGVLVIPHLDSDTSSGPEYGAQTVLPFTGLGSVITGLAVDAAGNAYVADTDNQRVVMLDAGSNSQTVLPFTDLYSPTGVAVDAAGNVYVGDTNNQRVVMLAAGSNSQTVLPFTGLDGPTFVAVDTARNVYVADVNNNRVVMLAEGSSRQTVLPFNGLNHPSGVAVDTARNVYVADRDNNRVVTVAEGADAPTVVPFTDLNRPVGLALGADGSVYVADRDNNRVVKLPKT